MREITSPRELHSILLDIAKEFHRICVKHDIPYYMVAGTMLGAVRHKGFIPWDDDMDFGVPREHYERLKSVFQKELSEKYNVFTMDNSESLLINILKISDMRTEIFEIYKENLTERIGVNIDIFPLDSVDKKTCKRKTIQLLLRLQGYIFLSIKSRTFIKKIIALSLKILRPFLSRNTIINYIEKHLIGKEGRYITNIYGAYGARETMAEDVVGNPVLYEFEDTSFYGVANPSAYLSLLYGDYMELPPESKRHLHIKDVYWK